MTRRVIIIHGWESNSREQWFPEAKKVFEKVGHDVSIPDMPDTNMPIKEKWIQIIRAYSPDPSTILIGLSLGGTAILRYLEQAEAPIETAMILGAPIYSIGATPIDNFFMPEFDWLKMRRSAKHFFLVYQRDDPVVPFQQGEDLARALGVSLMAADGDDHFEAIDTKWLLETVEPGSDDTQKI